MISKFKGWYVQLANYFLILLSNSDHDPFLTRESCKGDPKYLDGRELSRNPIILQMLSMVIRGVLREKIRYFWSLISRPEASSNYCKHRLIFLASCIDGCPINILSSTNCWWVWTFAMGCTLRAWTPYSAWVALMNLTMPSAIIMKRKGDRGYPCLIPLEGLMRPTETPLIRIENNVVETSFIIHFIQSFQNPKALRTSLICYQFSLY